MKPEQIQISDIEYNPTRSAFEALVTIRDYSGASRYPVTLPAPLNASFETVSRGLTARAKLKHRKATPGLKSRIATVAAAQKQLTADGILNMILKPAA